MNPWKSSVSKGQLRLKGNYQTQQLTGISRTGIRCGDIPGRFRMDFGKGSSCLGNVDESMEKLSVRRTTQD